MGKLIKARSMYYGETSIPAAEARALRDRVTSAVQVEFNEIVIEGDNQTLIQALRENIYIPRQISNIIKDRCACLG